MKFHIFSNKNQNKIITSYVNEVQKAHELNKQINLIDKSSPQASPLRKKLNILNAKLISEIDKFPNDKIGLLFLAMVKPINHELDEINGDSFDAGIAAAILQKKPQFITAEQLRDAYQFILPHLNVHNLKSESPINNLLLYQILKDKNLLGKLAQTQLERTFVSSAYSKSLYDERIDYAIIMLKTDFTLLYKNCNLTKIVLDLQNELKNVVTPLPIGKVFYKKALFDLLLNKFEENKQFTAKILTHFSETKEHNNNFNSLDLNTLTPKEIQNLFDIALNLNDKYKTSNFNFHRNVNEIHIDKDLALKIYQTNFNILREEQIKNAFLKAIHVCHNKKLLIPELATLILENSKSLLIKNTFLIERLFVYSSQMNSNFILTDKNLLNEGIYLANKENIILNYEIVENIYLKITKYLNKNRNDFLVLSQILLQYLHKLNSTKSSHLDAYY